MSPVAAFKLILLSFVAIVALECIAKRLRLPPAAALLMGGIGIAFIPGLPPVTSTRSSCCWCSCRRC